MLMGLVLLMVGCRINGTLTKGEVAKDAVGKPISVQLDFIRDWPNAGASIVSENSYVMPNGHQVMAIDVCDARCVPWTPYYSCIVFYEVDEKSIVVNAWPDPESWKVRPKSEQGDYYSSRVCEGEVLPPLKTHRDKK